MLSVEQSDNKSTVSALDIVALLYAFIVLGSLALTIYAVYWWRVALPSYDVVDHQAFLAAAAEGQMDWQWLWERHNGVHLIVLPKLIFWLDMYCLAGQGWLVTGVSALVTLATVWLLVLRIYSQNALSLSEKRCFSLLAILFFSSMLMAESLLNPIDIQWSFLASGSVVLAMAMDGERWNRKRAALFAIGVGISVLSAGPVVLICTAIFLCFFLTTESTKKLTEILISRKLLAAFSLLILFMSLWEFVALRQHWPLLIVQILKAFHSITPENIAAAENYLRATPSFYGKFFIDGVVFLARFCLVPIGDHWPLQWALALPFCMWLVLLWRSIASWNASQRFWVYLVFFGFMLAVAAGMMRFWGLYGYRHANMGGLLLLSSMLLIYQSLHVKWKDTALVFFMLLYAVQFIYCVIHEAGSWAFEGTNIPRFQQIGNALGVHDPARFSVVWKADVVDVKASEKNRNIFQTRRVGVYGSEDYAYFLQNSELPKREKSCAHRLIQFERLKTDARAFVLRAASRDEFGQAVTRALFLDGDTPIGWAAVQMPSDSLWQQWHEPLLWGGYGVFIKEVPKFVQVIAFGGSFRCEPWTLSVPTIEPSGEPKK